MTLVPTPPTVLSHSLGDALERRTFAFTEVLGMVERGDIEDAMTVVAVLRAARRRGR